MILSTRVKYFIFLVDLLYDKLRCVKLIFDLYSQIKFPHVGGFKTCRQFIVHCGMLNT